MEDLPNRTATIRTPRQKNIVHPKLSAEDPWRDNKNALG